MKTVVLNQDELNEDMLNYLTRKVEKHYKGEFKLISDHNNRRNKALEMLSNEISSTSWIPYLCKYVDKMKKLKGQYKKNRVVAYYKYLCGKIGVENQYSDEQLNDIIDLIIKSSRFVFYHNVKKWMVVKNIGVNLVLLSKLLIPFVKFFQ